MANTERLEIDLPEELAAYVHDKVGRNALASESNVVQEAVRVMQQRDARLETLRSMVESSLSEGGSLTDEQVASSLEQRARSWREPGN